MSAAFRLDTKGGHEIEARLGALVDAFGDLTPLMRDFGTYLETATGLRFEGEEAPDGSAWKKSIRAKEDGGKTLTDTALLKQSIHSVAGSDSVQIGTNKIYAGIHQFGFDGTVTVPKHSRTIDQAFGRRLKAPVTFDVDPFERLLKMPARPFLGLSSEDETELVALAEDYARDAMGGAA